MKILLLTQVLPYPPDSGPKVKTWFVLQSLCQLHSVTLASFVRGDESAGVEMLRRLGAQVHTAPIQRTRWRDLAALARSLATRLPWSILRDDRVAMRQLVDRLVAANHFDVVHIDQLNMAPYARRVPGARRVLDAHNALWMVYRRLAHTQRSGPLAWLFGREWRLLKRYEAAICRDCDAVLAVSNDDRAALETAMHEDGTRAAVAPVTVIPIAIDSQAVAIVPRAPAADHVLHLGTLQWPPAADGLLWFLHEILPLVRAQRPRLHVDIVGARPGRRIEAFAGDAVTVSGYVDDPLPFIQRAGVMIVPLRAAGGMRVKILSALAQGVPVVSTTIGCEGIAVTPGVDILVADTAPAFAAAVHRVLDDPALARQLATNGRRLVERLYDYRIAHGPLAALYQRLMGAADTAPHSSVLANAIG